MKKRTKINPSSPPIPFLHFLQKENEDEEEKEISFLHPVPSPFQKRNKKENPRIVGDRFEGKTKEERRVGGPRQVCEKTRKGERGII